MGGSSIPSTKRAPRTFAKGEGGLFPELPFLLVVTSDEDYDYTALLSTTTTKP